MDRVQWVVSSGYTRTDRALFIYIPKWQGVDKLLGQNFLLFNLTGFETTRCLVVELFNVPNQSLVTKLAQLW